METLYVPYRGTDPAVISVKGHPLVVLSEIKGVLEQAMDTIDADSLRPLADSDHPESRERELEHLAHETNGLIVLAGPDENIDSVICELEKALPWVQ